MSINTTNSLGGAIKLSSHFDSRTSVRAQQKKKKMISAKVALG